MTGFDIGEAFQRARLIGETELLSAAPKSGGAQSDFGDALAEAVREVDKLGKNTKHTAEAIARGEPVEVHELMIAMGKSEVAFNMMLEVRNKMIEAWQTLSRSVG